jgi:aconitate hydratase
MWSVSHFLYLSKRLKVRYLDIKINLVGGRMSINSFNARANLTVLGENFEIFDITQIPGAQSLPFSLKILLENLLRTEDGANITTDQIRTLANWDPAAEPSTEIQFTPARVIMQDFTGVPCIVDLAIPQK